MEPRLPCFGLCRLSLGKIERLLPVSGKGHLEALRLRKGVLRGFVMLCKLVIGYGVSGSDLYFENRSAERRLEILRILVKSRELN